MGADCKVQGMMEKLYSENPRHEASVTTITTRYVETTEAYPMLKRNIFNVFVVGKERIPAILVEGELLSKSQVKTYKLVAIVTPGCVSKYRCALCPHSNDKKCDECHYEGESEEHRYMILDDLMKLAKTFFSAIEKGQFDVASELADEITEIISKYDLPKLDQKKSKFTMIQFETNSRTLRRLIK